LADDIPTTFLRRARQPHPELPKEFNFFVCLDLDMAAGQEYWAAMGLMSQDASANHQLSHKHLARYLGASVLLDIEHHHKFAWKERHRGRDVSVHRKGATPAGRGVLGVIPGARASATFVARGKGNAEALNFAAHGAGRVMSRHKDKESFNWKMAQPYLDERGVKLISAGWDEVPMVYKNIEDVRPAPTDLVEPLARFFPRLVKMAESGERAEDKLQTF